MSELFMIVALRAKQGKEQALKKDLIAVVQPSREEQGSISYELFEDQEDPGLFVFYEHWASIEERDQHHNHGAHIQYFQENGIKNVEKIEFSHTLKRLA